MNCLGCKHEHFSTICTLCKEFSMYEVENMQVLTQEEHNEAHGIKSIELNNAQREFVDDLKSRTGYTIHFTEQEVDRLYRLVEEKINQQDLVTAEGREEVLESIRFKLSNVAP